MNRRLKAESLTFLLGLWYYWMNRRLKAEWSMFLLGLYLLQRRALKTN
jgi:hypothetical protein